MKKVKQKKTNIKLVFTGGVTVQMDTAHSLDELKRIMNKLQDDGEVQLDNVEDEMAIADNYVTVYNKNLLMYMVAEYNTSNLVTPGQPGKLHRVQ